MRTSTRYVIALLTAIGLGLTSVCLPVVILQLPPHPQVRLEIADADATDGEISEPTPALDPPCAPEGLAFHRDPGVRSPVLEAAHRQPHSLP